MIEYTLTRSNRKTVAIYVRVDGVEVRAPLRTPKRDIDKFVLSKEKWIINKQAKLAIQARERKSFRLTYGSTVTYRGKPCLIVAISNERPDFKNGQFCIPSNLSPEEIKEACIKIYHMLAKRDLTEMTSYFAERMGVKPAAIKINSAKSRWGSCSEKKSINFSWLLIMADDDVIEYVVVHELAHIIELNHSKRFWAIIEKILPDYKTRRKRLKDLQTQLSKEDW